MINNLIYFFIFLIGLAIGSFLNVVIYRLPKGEEIIFKPSHCPKCKQKIKPLDLIPILSYIILRGKCRYCKEKISFQYPLVELLAGLSLTGIYYRFGWAEPVHTIAMMTLILIFIVVLFIDLYHYIIPNEIIIFGLITGFIFGILKGKNFLIDSSLGFLIGILTFFLIVVIGELLMKAEAMGMGDVKLMGIVGLFLGWKLTILSMFLAFITGSIVSIFLLVAKIKGRRDQIPFGPFIAIGSTIAFLWGNQILSWYFNLGTSSIGLSIIFKSCFNIILN